ncbi:helix-turn-helix domain-containing protein [Acinetobacter stercoris]|uniref:helix-turn-helix domain-containing protein n=1 Tax=Acinetobacter stercoris TaxID=2126983 RepID=UPI001D17FC61|nr:helix-turn-helix domain-containing protein [Acinetobacter stercoris]
MLNLKIKQADPFLLEILCDQANYLIKDMPQEDSFIELVYIHIIKAIENNHAQIDYIAKSLNTSPRMLQKDLKKRGISFQMILNNTRINLAKKHLKNESLSITEIAFLLAYKDQTSFNRAFKNWTGVAPSIWRKKNLYNI